MPREGTNARATRFFFIANCWPLALTLSTHSRNHTLTPRSLARLERVRVQEARAPEEKKRASDPAVSVWENAPLSKMDDANPLAGAAAVPTDLGKHLVACVSCRLVKTAAQFEAGGCENCTFLEMEGDEDAVRDATTSDFRGVMALPDPAGSWAARWTRLRGGSSGKPVPGVYAVALGSGVVLLPAVEEAMRAAGVAWVRGTEG